MTFQRLVPSVRLLDADDLDIGVGALAEQNHASTLPDTPLVPIDHPRIVEIVRLAAEYGGVILTGPPGTSKSYFAAQAAAAIVQGDNARRRFVQFHASYQYEDFVTGYRPTATGFEPSHGPFLELAQAARNDPGHEYVLVIDELSRGDTGRIFGEALTYVERSKRGMTFTISAGIEAQVPPNLVIIATMNPFDRGVDEVDAAFERRFAKISMDPDPGILQETLTRAGMTSELQDRVLGWFNRINGLSQKNAAAAVGHAYFEGVGDEEALRDLWNYQLKYLVARAFRRDENTRADLTTAWGHLLVGPSIDDVTEDAPPETQDEQ